MLNASQTGLIEQNYLLSVARGVFLLNSVELVN